MPPNAQTMPRPQPNPDDSVQTLPKPRPSAHPEPVEGSEPVEEPTVGRRPYNPAAEVPGARYRTSGSLIGRLGQIEIANRREFRLHDRHSDWATPYHPRSRTPGRAHQRAQRNRHRLRGTLERRARPPAAIGSHGARSNRFQGPWATTPTPAPERAARTLTRPTSWLFRAPARATPSATTNWMSRYPTARQTRRATPAGPSRTGQSSSSKVTPERKNSIPSASCSRSSPLRTPRKALKKPRRCGTSAERRGKFQI